MKRRSFVQLLAAEAALPFASRLAPAATTSYRVGVGSSTDGYTAAQRALTGSGEFPNVSGLNVIVKPNLVIAAPSTSGATTDPQVVRAVVDLALAGGAADISIIEGGIGQTNPAHFSECGYSFFNSYDPKVQLVDLATQSPALVPIANGFAYRWMYLPSLVTKPNTVFISVGKLKTHVNAFASLSMKNLIALANPAEYSLPNLLPRVDLHFRGIDQAVVDVNLARPIHFAVVDGIWGMQGNGPAEGTPVAANVVLAGKNPVAVDRAGVYTMRLPQSSVAHLHYATVRGLGPDSMNSVQLVGDAFSTFPFEPASVTPLVWRPAALPGSLSLSGGQPTNIYYAALEPCYVALQIVSQSDFKPGMTPVRELSGWESYSSGIGMVTWDGLDQNGVRVTPGTYSIRAIARQTPSSSKTSFASNWIKVTA